MAILFLEAELEKAVQLTFVRLSLRALVDVNKYYGITFGGCWPNYTRENFFVGSRAKASYSNTPCSQVWDSIGGRILLLWD